MESITIPWKDKEVKILVKTRNSKKRGIIKHLELQIPTGMSQVALIEFKDEHNELIQSLKQ